VRARFPQPVLQDAQDHRYVALKDAQDRSRYMALQDTQDNR
jgi:hypothetical protein